ncbi:MAG: phage tail protein I [Synergistaceae bacterium]|nr:phage tail protein I [Synergistaceae bacterium]MBR0234684.1 phage tail protein I [Synergistaceae bacterium]
MAKKLSELSLFDIAPTSIKADEIVINIIKAIDPELLNVSDAISEAFIISRIKTLPEPVLDLLAWQWHVDFYELANNIYAKRDMVLNSIQWHRKKGTRGAIISALEMLGVEAKFIAWYEEEENKNNPYTFTIDAKITGDFWERVDWTKPTQTIRRAITESKAARSYISRLYIYFEDNAGINVSAGVGAFAGSHYIIKPEFNSFECKTKVNMCVAPLVCPAVHQVVGWKYNTEFSININVSAGLGMAQGIYTKLTMKE